MYSPSGPIVFKSDEGMSQDYYTLSWSRPGHWYEKEKQLSAAADTVRIGQQEGCDAQIGNDGIFADEVFALIRPDTPEGWSLIPVSCYIQCFVNGSPVSLVHHLQDGDRIRFSEAEEEFLFEVRQDEYVDRKGVLHSTSLPRPVRIILFTLPFLLIGLLSLFVIRHVTENSFRERAIAALHSSVLQIQVDSVYFVRTTSESSRILRSFSYVHEQGGTENGTAFLTKDSLLVTARHCIEPWLNYQGIFLSTLALSGCSLPVQWALEAETYNQTHTGDTVFSVVSKCTFARGEDASEVLGLRLLSSDFIYDISRDEIVELGNFNQEFYWRSITERFARRDMMLDDIAYVHAGMAGSIRLATKDQLPGLLEQGTALTFMGYPNYQTKGFERSEGTVRRSYSEGEMIIHNGQLVTGYSGGPVLVNRGTSVTAVGVISVVDNKGGSRIYSVPVSEMKKEGNDD